MADARENHQEAERRSDEIESRSIEEPKEKEDEADNLQEQRPSSIGSSIPSSDKSKERMTQSSPSYPVRPGVKDCQFYIETGLCRFCRYNHPIQLPKELPERVSVPVCKYFLSGDCKFGSVCVFRHLNDRNVAQPMYQPRRTQRRYETESESRPKKRAKTILDSGEPGHEEDLEEGEFREEENPQEQIQRNTERQGTEAQDNNLQFHQQQEEMQRPQSHTTQQHQLLASHFNIYPLVENLTDVIEAGTRDQNSDALVTEVSSHFDKCQQILNSISRSLGSKTNKYVDGQKQNLEESEQLLQQRKELIDEYKKSVEEIVKKEP